MKLREIWASTGWNVTLATCAEDIDLTVYGIEHNRCIDGDLMERVFGEDYELVYYLRTGQLPEPDLFGTFPALPDKRKELKDKGQRKACGCMISKISVGITLAPISVSIVMPIQVGNAYKRMRYTIRTIVKV